MEKNLLNRKFFCRKCRGPRNHKSLFETQISDSEFILGENEEGFSVVSEYLFRWYEKYSIIQCLGCETISFLKEYGRDEPVRQSENGDWEYYHTEDIYPAFLDGGEEIIHQAYLPTKIQSIYSETITALKSQSYILAAGGLRAIIEAVCNHLDIRKDVLSKRIDQLHTKGHLTSNESRRLHSIRFLGNNALHEIEKPRKDQLYLLLGIVNHLLSNLFINDKLMEGEVDTLINQFEGFLKLIISNLSRESTTGQELTISEILGNSKRRIIRGKLQEFEEQLISDIKSNKFEYLSLKDELEKNSVYEIIKIPFWVQ